MQSFFRRIRVVARHKINNLKIVDPISTSTFGLSSSESNVFISKGSVAKYFKSPIDYSIECVSELAPKFVSPSSTVLHKKFGEESYPRSSDYSHMNKVTPLSRDLRPAIFHWAAMVPTLPSRCIASVNYSSESVSKDTSSSVSESEVAPRIKFKRLDKTAKHIMQILDKEAVEEVRAQREIPDIKPGYIIQLKVEVPENKRRASLVKGIVIARRNAGLNTTIRLRRMVAGVGVESLLPLYSPNIKGIKVLDKKKVRRAKLYYLRDKLNPLRR